MSNLTKPEATADFTPWAQTREESEHDYAHFRLWLELAPRPPPLDPALSIRHNWQERAAAFDSYELIKGLGPKQRARAIFEMWSGVITNETRKWYGKSLRSQHEPVLQPHNVQEFIDLVTDPARNQAAKEAYDLTGLSPEEVETLNRILEKAKKKGSENA